MISGAMRFNDCARASLLWIRPRRRACGAGRLGALRLSGIFTLALSLLAVCLTGGNAEAMQLSPQQKLEMKQHYEKATRAYDVQKYTEAVEEYQKAYEIGGDPAMLYNVAQSYRLADQLPEALRFYRRYLQRSPNARNREDVERKISDLEKTIEERRRAAAALPSAPVAPPPVVVVAPPPATPTMKSDEGAPATLVAGIVVASVGAAALVAAAITGKMAADKGDQLTAASMNEGTFDPNVEKNGKTLDRITIVSLVAGAAAAITGAVLIIVSQSGDQEVSAPQPAASLSPVFGGGIMGAAATLRF